MITLLTGKKGSGKTKKLIELVHAAVESSNGNVVCIEKGDTLTSDVDHSARLKIGGSDLNDLMAFLAKVKALTDEAKVKITFSISADSADFPAGIAELAEIK